MGFLKRRKRVLIPILILLGGILIMGALSSSRGRPLRSQFRPRGALVEVAMASSADRRVIVTGNGIVSPRYEVVLQPQVTGKVVWVHPDLVAGGSFSEGDELFRIDRSDYALAVQGAEAQVAQADYRLQVAKANAVIAAREWDLMNAGRVRLTGQENAELAPPDPLVMHEPQLKQAEAGLASARAALHRAHLNLERTALRAPFNCRVRRQTVAPGQLVSPVTQTAVLYGTDIFEIEVGLQLSDLAWIEIPGSMANITLHMGAEQYSWSGTVVRSLGVVDEIGRLARVVVQIDRPLKGPDPGGAELSIGSFVSVEIEGRLAKNIIPVPRRAVHSNSTIWVAAPDSTLEIREVVIQRLTPMEALVVEGLTPGEFIVLTPLAGAAPGMKLRLEPIGRENRG